MFYMSCISFYEASLKSFQKSFTLCSKHYTTMLQIIKTSLKIYLNKGKHPLSLGITLGHYSAKPITHFSKT